MGFFSIIFAIIGVFFLTNIFIPLGVIFGVIAVCNKDYLCGSVGIAVSIGGFLTSSALIALAISVISFIALY